MVITFEIEETIGTNERAAQDITRCPYGRQIGEQTTNWKTGDGNRPATREEKHPYRVSGLVQLEVDPLKGAFLLRQRAVCWVRIQEPDPRIKHLGEL